MAKKWKTPVRLLRCLAGAVLLMGDAGAARAAKSFTVEQALSAPFSTELRAAPVGGGVAWVANIDGRRNLWVAQPEMDGSAKQVTQYNDDDGQEISGVEWTPDGKSIVYVRGGDTEGLSPEVPNPADLPHGAKEQVWKVSANGGEPMLLGEGHDPAISPDGKLVAFIAKKQIWIVPRGDSGAKPEQLIDIRGSQSGLRWSPDGTRLAFVCGRGDHSYVVAYSVADKKWTYMDPSTDRDQGPVWSPDSKQIAYLRIPGDKDAMMFVARRGGFPWSIRVAEAGSGRSREVWRAAEEMGSVYHATDSADQLHWTAGGEIVFPWERDGWLHFYSVAENGGTVRLLTRGEFEVEHVSLSEDRRSLVFDSNQEDHRSAARVANFGGVSCRRAGIIDARRRHRIATSGYERRRGRGAESGRCFKSSRPPQPETRPLPDG